jgi:Antitoxin ParD
MLDHGQQQANMVELYSICDAHPSPDARSELSSLRDLSEELDMRINYEIPDELHHRAKALAALEGKTLREFIVEALADAVDRRARKETTPGDSG